MCTSRVWLREWKYGKIEFVKKIVIFPYHPDIITIMSYKDDLKGYSLSGIISYTDDFLMTQSLNKTIGSISNDYLELLDECDTVIILDNYRGFKFDKYYQVINDVISLGKELMITPLACKQLELDTYKGKYYVLGNNPLELNYELEGNTRNVNKILNEIDIPVISVVGEGKNCNKFELQLLLKHVLEREYTIVTISSNPLGALFGCFTLPLFFFESIGFEEKIMKFNHWVSEIIKIDSTDVLLLGIPEGITPFRKSEFNHFAEYPLVASTAIPIDIAILCMYFIDGTVTKEGLYALAEFCRQKFNILVAGYTISRVAYLLPSDDIEEISYDYLDDFFLKDYYPEVSGVGLRMVSMVNRVQAELSIKECLEILERNASII